MDAPLREYVEGYLPEDAVITAARARGADLGCVPIGSGGGAALRFLTAALQAKAVVEVGTGAGVGSLYLLGGMPAAGVLTSIDAEPEHQRAARVAFAEAGVAVSRTRLIMGQALDVLPRLTDGAYDLVFVDAAKTEYPKYLEEGVRLLRPGGVIAFDNVLWEGRVVDASHRDPETSALREVARSVREDERLAPVILPLGDGLLVAAKLD
ncbi:O-methyltransferase [Actinosynnema sp. NPDC047251]|uniref:Putative O-methyltransferase n=1 Tax=Saccharothrix espanaensis (strain ATCC 51144 / DSM 44229 / JCM 9112 / NBRC 15066 / NRRL 15764) TaxID=1179773 RepID=K0JTR4_SACES|nr:O-methyltransferase [Saccharothrix espanaensis]CCH28209.1 putative O-methyltransferase [Saccharothrix espanaensis DSM 44229]